MSKEKIYPVGVRVFNPHEKAPDFIKGEVVITLNEFFQFCKEHPELLTEYNGQKQLKLQLQSGNKGLTCVVNTWRKESKEQKSFTNDKEELPF